MNLPTAARAAKSRGFTLVELLVVVVIVGVLAAIGIRLFREYIFSSKTVEAVSVMQAIRGAQEQYRAETQQYLNVSTEVTWYPNQNPGKTARHWKQPTHPHYPAWQRLAVHYNHPVQFGYLVTAGAAGTNHTVPQTVSQPGWPNPATEPWYVIQARANADGDSTFAQFVASSYNSEIYSEGEGE